MGASGPGASAPRVVTGVGVPQVAAIQDAVRGAGDVPIIADGGIKYSGDIVKALAAGASSRDDGLDARRHRGEPGRVVPARGPPLQDDPRDGQLSAMQDGSADRYFQEGEMSPKKLVPEGIEGRVPYKGPVADVLFQMVGGLRSGMGYVGCGSIDELRTHEFVRITAAGLRESHPHDVTITREAPNYSVWERVGAGSVDAAAARLCAGVSSPNRVVRGQRRMSEPCRSLRHYLTRRRPPSRPAFRRCSTRLVTDPSRRDRPWACWSRRASPSCRPKRARG